MQIDLSLRMIESRVGAAQLDQLVVVSNLGDSSFLEDDDAIGLAKRANSVRDCDGRAF